VTESIQPQQATKAFDERTALAELELLADKIQKSRVQREQAVAEFDAFVKAFRHEHLSDSIAASDTERRRLEDRSTALNAAAHAAGMTAFLPEPVAEPEPAVAAPASVIPVPVETATTEFVPGRWEPEEAEQTAAPVVARGPRAPRAAHVGVVLAALAVLAVGVLLWKSSSDPVAAPPPSEVASGPSPSAAAAPAAAPVQAPAAVPAPAAPAGPPRALTIEFVTLRPVWARITVDGKRAFEREFPANQRVPLGADRTIAVRAGDAGAIRLIVDGRDQGVLGKDGQVYNRTFTPTLR
jgi:hypothetical protein